MEGVVPRFQAGASNRSPPLLPIHPGSYPPAGASSFPSFQSTAAGSAESAATAQPGGSPRRRRFLRLTRSGSDPRGLMDVFGDNDRSDTGVVSGPRLRMPSKRKASSQAKSDKSAQYSSSTDTASSADLPLIRSEHILSADRGGMRSPLSSFRELMYSSDEDGNEDDYRVITGAPPALQQLLERRLESAKKTAKRSEAIRMGSAVLLSDDTGHQNPAMQINSSCGMRYLPLCPANRTLDRYETASHDHLTVLPSYRQPTHRSGEASVVARTTWPRHDLPVEIFDLITMYLACDDVKSMRLVDREFEQKVSRSLFHTSVVPFNTEIYDMMDEDRKSSNRPVITRNKGKGKTKASPASFGNGTDGDPGGLQWQNAKQDIDGKVYKGHGLRVFRGFGPHIKRFGMSFEISERQLSQPPEKKELDHVSAYHGSYDWPSINYARFAALAGLENAADETSRMKAAFAHLEIVQELALSVDSGLGWLNGPDKSSRALLFENQTPVFGSAYAVPDHATQATTKLWNALQQSQQTFDPHNNRHEITLGYKPMFGGAAEIDGLRNTTYSDVRTWSTADRSALSRTLNTIPYSFGVLYTTSQQSPAEEVRPRYDLMPGDLSKEQREWLLETQWAQQAFLESYMLAIVDNPVTFCNVTTFNIAKLSSRFLPMLARDTFWQSLPSLSDVILHVSADWRMIEKDDAGFAQTVNMFPSKACRIFHRGVLQACIAPRKSIKKLNVGWAGGGEHAEGMFARNGNLLPAPVTQPDRCTTNSDMFVLAFDHVEHLTLSNCWITPPVLETVVKQHATKRLKQLTLDSVSLTTHPKFPSDVQGAGVPQLAHVVAALQAQMANHAGAPGPQAFPNPQMLVAQPLPQQQQQQLAALQQHLHNQMNQAAQIVHGNVAAPAQIMQPPNGIPAPSGFNNSTNWMSGHREGSWPELINAISPGTVFDDYLPAPAPWEAQPELRHETALRQIEFKSCGYARLPNHTGFDQTAIIIAAAFLAPHATSTWFRTRWNNLKPAMMTTSDRNIGQIVQHMPPRELHALQFAWDLSEGWGQDCAKAEDARFDGLFRGGTGRFSGVVQRGMPLVARVEQ